MKEAIHAVFISRGLWGDLIMFLPVIGLVLYVISAILNHIDDKKDKKDR